MGVFKLTAFLQNQNGYGWSESYYMTSSNSYESVAGTFLTVMRARLQLSTSDIYMPYLRVSDVAIFRDRYTTAFTPNSAGGNKALTGSSDPAYSALMVNLISNPLQQGRLFMRGVPDSMSIAGNWVPTGPWVFGFNNWTTELQLAGLQLRNVTRPLPTQFVCAGIDATGLVTTLLPHGFVLGNKVQFYRLPISPRAPGPWTVINPITANTFTVAFWGTRGAVSGPFKVAMPVIGYFGIGSTEIVGLREHRTGRPFFTPRGRRVKVK